MRGLTVEQVRKVTDELKKKAINPEPCGCIKYQNGIVLTCTEHNVPMTKEQIKIAMRNLKGFGITLKKEQL